MLYRPDRPGRPAVAWSRSAWVGLKAVIWGLEEWYRKSELSCDRAGLLASQDPEAARGR